MSGAGSPVPGQAEERSLRGGPDIVMVRGRSRGRGRIGGGIAVGRGRARGSIGVLGFNPETGGIVVGRRGRGRGTPRRPLIEIDNAESGVCV